MKTRALVEAQGALLLGAGRQHDLVAAARPSSVQRGLQHGATQATPAVLGLRDTFDTPLRLDEVAQAAGCSLRTLSLVFRKFRDPSPLAALRAIRLDEARTALLAVGEGVAGGEVARRYGFTNAGRFAAADRRPPLRRHGARCRAA